MEEEVEYLRCKRCGRVLKSEESMKLGYGPMCYAKYIETKLKKKHLIRYSIKNDRERAEISK